MLRKIRAFMALGLLAGAAWVSTAATFTDQATATSTFTSGTIDLLLNAEADDAYAFTSLEMSNMKPGDVKYAALTVANNGTLAFTYSMSTSATSTTPELRHQLQMGIRKVAATCDATNYGNASGADILTAEGNLSAGAISSRALAVSGSEILCFKVELPSATDDTYQNKSTTATFTFNATQS